MVKMIDIDKKETNGGMDPMMLWVIITGIIMAVSTLSSITTNAIAATSGSNDQNGRKTHSSYNASHKSGGYLRISPFPMRSAITMPF